jgi:uncharacterized cupredoxin-like copper-binding protein
MRAILAFLILPLLLAGCTSEPNVADPIVTPTPTTATNTTMAPMAIEVAVGDGTPPTLYTISPATLELKVGMAYSLTLKNNGRGAHDLVIPDLEVTIPSTAAGATSDPVIFTPTAAGEFEMYCTLGPGGTPLSHREGGMSGTVVVS